MGRVIDLIDRGIGAVVAGARWLALPVLLLLLLQWPLRDLARCCSREANDLGQWLFALFIAVSITAATRAGVHLAAETSAHHSERRRRLVAVAGAGLMLLPWALFILVASGPQVMASLRVFERFPDTFNPGYFIIKLALWLLAGLVALQGIVDVARAFGVRR